MTSSLLWQHQCRSNLFWKISLMPSKWMKWLVHLSFFSEALAIQSWEGVILKNPVEPP